MARSSSSFSDRFRSLLQQIGLGLRTRTFWLGFAGMLVGLLVLLLLFNSILMPGYTRQNASTTVPELRELSYDDAVRLASQHRLRPQRRDQPYNPAFERDAVVDQNPAPNSHVKPGRRIYLYVNTGVERSVAVPNVLTLSESRARTSLRQLGFSEVTIQNETRPSPNAGTVTRQVPEAGTIAPLSEPITLYISIGPGDESVEIPDVRGLSADAAVAELEGVGLWVNPTQVIDGTITRQTPAPGSRAREGSEVRLYSEPLPTDPDEDGLPPIQEIEEGIPVTDDFPQPSTPPANEPPPQRDPNRTDW